MKKQVPRALDTIVDKVLAYRPKPKPKPVAKKKKVKRPNK